MKTLLTMMLLISSSALAQEDIREPKANHCPKEEAATESAKQAYGIAMSAGDYSHLKELTDAMSKAGKAQVECENRVKANAADAGAPALPCAKEYSDLKATSRRAASADEVQPLVRAHRAALTAYARCEGESRKRAKEEDRDAERKRTEDAERAAQEQQAQEETDATERAARIQKNSADKRLAPVALAGALCFNAGLRAAALKEIAQQKKYARIGGVIDKSDIKDEQDRIRGADDGITQVRTILKKLKFPALACGDARVRKVSACIAAGSLARSHAENEEIPDECGEGDLGLELETLTDHETAMDPLVFR